MGVFSNLFKNPDWVQKSKEGKSGWISNFDPTSRRYMDPEGLEMSDDGSSSNVAVGVQSTAVQGYTYNPKTQSLYVQFRGSNKDYEYPNVPRDVVEDFGRAPSKGRFVHDVLKPEYSVGNG